MRSADELRKLASREFSAVLAADPELRRLDELKLDKVSESRVLLEVLGLGDYRIGKLPVRPLTAAKWAFLWLLDSPFATGGDAEEADLDVMLYVLSVRDLREIPVALHEIPAAASGRAAATGLRAGDLIAEIRQTVRTAFFPLGRLPAAPVPDRPAQFDGVWAAHAAGLAARESGTPFDVCLHRMSLAAVCCLLVAMRMRESLHPEHFVRPPDGEIAKQISARIDDLAETFLKGKKHADDL